MHSPSAAYKVWLIRSCTLLCPDAKESRDKRASTNILFQGRSSQRLAAVDCSRAVCSLPDRSKSVCSRRTNATVVSISIEWSRCSVSHTELNVEGAPPGFRRGRGSKGPSWTWRGTGSVCSKLGAPLPQLHQRFRLHHHAYHHAFKVPPVVFLCGGGALSD